VPYFTVTGVTEGSAGGKIRMEKEKNQTKENEKKIPLMNAKEAQSPLR